MKVKDLIEFLSEQDPETPVLTHDCCYGFSDEPSAEQIELYEDPNGLISQTDIWQDGTKKTYIKID